MNQKKTKMLKKLVESYGIPFSVMKNDMQIWIEVNEMS